jgi:hypothetical protein
MRGDEQAARRLARKHVDAAGEGFVDQRLPVEEEAVEEEWVHWQCLSQRVDVELAAEPAHRDLKRMRRAVAAKRNRFAIEDDVARGQRPCGLDDLGDRRADIAKVARVDVDLVAGLVHLDARAIELEFERRLAEIAQRGVDAVAESASIGWTGVNGWTASA